MEKDIQNKPKTQGVAVSAFIKNSKEEILIIQRASHDTHPGLWELPGGGLEWGENPYDGIKREVKEECGIDVNVIKPFDIMSYTVDREQFKRHLVQVIFECTLQEEDPTVLLSHEHTAHQWVTKANLKSIDTTAFLKKHKLSEDEKPKVMK